MMAWGIFNEHLLRAWNPANLGTDELSKALPTLSHFIHPPTATKASPVRICTSQVTSLRMEGFHEVCSHSHSRAALEYEAMSI